MELPRDLGWFLTEAKQREGQAVHATTLLLGAHRFLAGQPVAVGLLERFGVAVHVARGHKWQLAAHREPITERLAGAELHTAHQGSNEWARASRLCGQTEF